MSRRAAVGLRIAGALLGLAAAARLHPIASQDAEPAAVRSLPGGAWAELLGVFRAPVADGLWLAAQRAWERRDAPGTQRLLHLATAADPGPLFFWLNGARMIAYDIAHWRLTAMPESGPPAGAFPAVAARIRSEQAVQAAAFLERGIAGRRQPGPLWAELGAVWLHAGEVSLAAAAFGEAARAAGGPDYAARLEVELLIGLGRRKEAGERLLELGRQSVSKDPEGTSTWIRQRLRSLQEAASEGGFPE